RQYLGGAADRLVQVGDWGGENELIRPVAGIEPHQLPEGRGCGITPLLEQLGRGQIRQGARPLRVRQRRGLAAHQALAQQRHRGVVLESLIGPHPLLQELVGRLRRQTGRGQGGALERRGCRWAALGRGVLDRRHGRGCGREVGDGGGGGGLPGGDRRGVDAGALGRGRWHRVDDRNAGVVGAGLRRGGG